MAAPRVVCYKALRLLAYYYYTTTSLSILAVDEVCDQDRNITGRTALYADPLLSTLDMRFDICKYLYRPPIGLYFYH